MMMMEGRRKRRRRHTPFFRWQAMADPAARADPSSTGLICVVDRLNSSEARKTIDWSGSLVAASVRSCCLDSQ